MTAGQADGQLERRARALLRAYPAAYRRDRGEEIIGTLLEATPPGRSFPLARDARALLSGGRSARAARNRAPGARENLRLALLLGLALFAVRILLEVSVGSTAFHPVVFYLTVVAAAAAALAPWAGNRALRTACVIPAAVAYFHVILGTYDWRGPGQIIMTGAFLIALWLLSARLESPARPPRSWAWLALAQPALLAGATAAHLPLFLIDIRLQWEWVPALLMVVALGWLVTDARPALGVSVAIGLASLASISVQLSAGGYDWLTQPAFLLRFALPAVISAAMAVAMAWRMRRQAAAR